MIVTTNLFGDIRPTWWPAWSAAFRPGPGANIGADAAIFEAVHGLAPDIAGWGKANPVALMLAAASDARPPQAHRPGDYLRCGIDR